MEWFILGWFVCAVLSTGILLADMQGSFPGLAQEYYRKDLALAVGLSLIFAPIALVMGFFLSGFCQHGWQLRYREPYRGLRKES